MQIEPGNKIILPTMPELDIPQKETPKTTTGNFADILKGLVSETNSLQKQAGDIQERFLLGEVQDIHSVMIAAEKASVAFSLVMEIRNKLLESYQTLLRIPL